MINGKSLILPSIMTRKYFPFDKNYLLKEAQASSREKLLSSLITTVTDCYQAYYNPLGLLDDTVLKIQSTKTVNLDYFEEFYDDLAGIYRYKFGEVQLEFLWDGTSHSDKYNVEWEKTFISWVRDFCHHQPFIRAVFDSTTFHNQLTRSEHIQSRLKSFLVNYFDLKIYQYKGIVENQEVA